MSDKKMLRDNRDDLTGLLDKYAFYEWGQDMIDDNDGDSNYAIVFFDLDNFKLFNANYGYEKGDELLIEISEILNEVFSGCLIARFSGDHFVVFAQSSQVVNKIENVRKKVKELQRNINIELKAGVYVLDDEKVDITRSADRARMACVSIKKKYDISYKFYDEELAGSLRRKQFILDSLDEAIEKEYIKVYYQPIVRSFTGEVCCWEALVRWIDPDRGMVYPNEFISVLEEYRFIHKLDCYVIEKVIKTFTEYKVQGMREAVPVSINLSRIDFEALDLVPYIDSLVEKYNGDRSMFRFEITESILMNNPFFIQEQISRFRESGYKIWMDDFGSGYSSLNVLKNFKFDLVKIDMEFLRDFDTSENGKIILHHMVSMLKNLGFHTLIEGIETEEQYEFMKNLGCELIQGYYIGRPMTFEDGVAELSNKKIHYESMDEKSFMDEVGLVDVLKQDPLGDKENVLAEKVSPLSIGVVKDGVWEFIYANEGYRNGVKIHGNETMAIAEDMINNIEYPWTEREQFWEICELSKKTNESIGMDFIENGKTVNMKARWITSDETIGSDAYLVSITSRDRYLSESYEKKSDIVSSYMFTFYECIDLYGINNDYFENLYMTNSRLHRDVKNKTGREIIKQLAEERVYEEDREHFLNFLNLDTVKERLMNENNGSDFGLFRILNPQDQYVWKGISIKIVCFLDQEVLLCCVSEASKEMSKHMYEYKNELVKKIAKENKAKKDTREYAFENIIKLVPAGVFWKDSERRFLGANQMFLDYYGLNSVESIIGKTDEDMGWHINPDPFMNDEISVIKEGKTIRNVEGECIVKGKVRKIVANKQPFVVDGKTIGLIGFFNDITEQWEEKENLQALTKTDTLTGLLNRRAFDEIIDKYVKQYESKKADFVMILADIDKFKQINDRYGHDIGDLVLKDVGNRISKVIENNSVAFRYGGDEFIILHQFKRSSEIDSIRHELNIKISQINRVDGVDIKIRLSTGVAVYSEVRNMNLLMQLADKRMYEEKEKHKAREKNKF